MREGQKVVLAVLLIDGLIFVAAESRKPATSAVSADPGAVPTFAVSDTPHVFIWRDEQAMKDARALIRDGAAKMNPSLLLPLTACMVDTGTRVTNVSRGAFTSTVFVVEGESAGCRGDVDNSFLSTVRSVKKNG